MRRISLFIFIFCFVFDLVALGMGQETWRFFSKPLLMPALLGYFLSETTTVFSLKQWIGGALFFSWIGDMLLMFENRNAIFFLLGLSAFLLAHVFYIIFFHKVRVNENSRSRWPLLVIVVIYYSVLITMLYPHLQDMKIPVPVYGIVISFMLLLALHLLFIPDKRAGRLMAGGAVLFVLSDSVLAINKFYRPFDTAGIITMLTYGLAQLFIIIGAIRYLHSSASRENNDLIAVT